MKLNEKIILSVSSWTFIALLFSWWMLFYISYNRNFQDYMVFSLWIVLGFWGLGLILSLFWLGLIGGLSLLIKPLKAYIGKWYILSSASAISIYLSARILSAQGVMNLVSGKSILWYVATFFIGIVVISAALSLYKRVNLNFRQYAIIFLLSFLVLLTVVPPVFGPNKAEKANVNPEAISRLDTGIKVYFLGLDGATWDIIDSYLLEKQQGQNFRKLIAEGAAGSMKSLQTEVLPMTMLYGMGAMSPSIWETMATGLHETDHNIFDFSALELPGMSSYIPLTLGLSSMRDNLINSTNHRGMRIWEILDSNGIQSLIVRWLTTWPVDSFDNSIIVSERFHLRQSYSVFPYSLEDSLPPFKKTPAVELSDRFDCLFSYTGKVSYSEIINNDPVYAREPLAMRIAFESYSVDKYYENLSHELLDRENPRFFAWYTRGLDNVQHMTWEFFQPEHFDKRPNEEEIKRLGCIIPGYYDYCDEAVGNFISRLDDKTILIVASDHGGQAQFIPYADFLETVMGKDDVTERSGVHHIDGVIAMYGPYIKQGYEIKNASVKDIAPTILYLMGFPVARDMIGKVITEAIEDDFLEKYPIRHIDTYGAPAHATDFASMGDSEIEDEIKDRLKALGYIR
ncbi:MAG: hypothetical protein GF307_12930 [candidate division Zixibacteria bacterium]|nr:hypothetical protein [candidate division Zixibacteria bacterium]